MPTYARGPCLDIDNFSQGAGIHFTGASATGEWIYGNFLGTDPTGTEAEPNYVGVAIDASAADNLIGTNGDGVGDASEQNLISGNFFAGVWIAGLGTSGNAVAGNLIGTDITGSVALNNGTQPVSDSLGDVFGGGVAISAGASGNRIGTDGASVDDVGERNIVAGSNNDGIDIYGAGTDANVVAGNFIGTDVTGTRSLGISGYGVFLAESASFNWIGVNPNGGTLVRDRGNVISGNGTGVQIVDASNDNVVAGDKIGTDAAGAVALGNTIDGVEIDSSSGNTIGGTGAGAANVISANGNSSFGVSSGVELDGSSDNLVEGDFIGTDATGTKALGNIAEGVVIDAVFGPSTDNTIGGSTAGAGNVISANGGFGLLITGAGVMGNVVQGNLIGTDLTGTVALGNRQGEAQIAEGNTIGGLTTPTGVFYGFDFASATTPLNLTFRGELAGPPQQLASGGPTAVYHIDVEADIVLLAIVNAEGLTARLMLLDAQGRVLVQSDRLSPTDPDPVIDQHLSAGNYSLVIESTGGAGTYVLTTSLAPSAAPFQAIPIGASVNAIVAADFNGDGRLDLAVAAAATIDVTDNSGEVSVFLGNGDGTFRSAVTYAVGSDVGAIVAGDFSGDGHIDLAVAVYDNNTVTGASSAEVLVLVGNGDGTFQPAAQYAVGGASTSATAAAMVAGDFNGDGDLDLAVADQGDLLFGGTNPGGVFVLTGDGDGTFQPAVLYAVGSALDAIVAGDFNGDGRLDLAATDEGSRVLVLLGKGDGTFQPQVAYDGGTYTTGIVAGDFTGDGVLDLAVENVLNTVSVLVGNGDGTFRPAISYALGVEATGIVAGDFDRDGRLDLALADGYSFDVSVLLGNGDGTFQPQVTYQVGWFNAPQPSAIVAGDFTGDGHIDLATATSAGVVSIYNGNDVSVLLGNGDGTFQPQIQARKTVDAETLFIVTGDFNGDGWLDLASTGTLLNEASEVSVLLGNGDGTFQPETEYAVGSRVLDIFVGDFNGDGRLDLAVNNSDGVQMLLGNGDGTFQLAETVAAGSAVDVADDFNGDGRIDLAVSDPDRVQILLSNGDGTFQPAETVALGNGESIVGAGDFNGDGRIDLALAGGMIDTPQGEVSVLLGNGDGTFQSTVISMVGALGDPAIDFNGDGKLDLADVNYDEDTVSVQLGNGDGTFQPQVTYAVGTGPYAIVAGDFNGDGLSDLATSNYVSSDVSVLQGLGNRTLADPSQLVTAPHATPLVVDVNGDGTDDVLVVDGDGDILYRQGVPGDPGNFEPPITVNPQSPDGSNSYTARDIAWIPNTIDGPLLASVDAQGPAVSLFAYRSGIFVRVGSLATGQLPAQIIAADLNGDGVDDLVVRNAGDGTLSVFFAETLIGPVNPNAAKIDLPTFLTPVTLPIGLGISDVEAVDTTGSGRLDLVVTNKLTAQVSISYNLGDRAFTAAAPYRAGTGLSEIDPSSTPEVTSLEATAGVAAGPLTPDGPTDLVTINPGSTTMDILDGLGGGRFANPLSNQTPSPAQVIRMADFTGNGIEDLAVLTAAGVSIYLGNGKGGFLSPTTYAVPPGSNGLTVADVTGSGKLDLLVGDTYGDVLVLLGNGNGTFEPNHEANQGVALAVADLTGNGSKDIIYADQSLDRVVVDYGAGNAPVLADRSTGLLDPGAVQLADLDGPDYPPDLIVADSGSNNVLIYPGLGNGQFGPAINGGHGYFVGTNPVGITVANLTHGNGDPRLDLVVADKGSNQVSILINNSQGNDISFAAGPRLNSGGSGPVSTVVGNFTGGAFPDLIVTNSQSNDVAVLPSRGQGFFYDTSPKTFPVGTNPVTSIVGNFDGQTDLLTVNSGSNDLTLISGFNGPDAVTTTMASGGVDPDAAFAFDSGSGFDDLVVGNAGDGELALFEGGPDGLGLATAATAPNVPDPTALAFSALTGGQVQFYAATAGSESAELVAPSLGVEEATPSQSGPTAAQNAIAQLVPLHESSLPLLATVLTLTITVSGDEFNLGLQETEATAVSAFLSGTGISVGQSVSSQAKGGPGGDDNAESDDAGTNVAGPVPTVIAPWARFVLGLDEAIEQFQRENPNGVSGAPAAGSSTDHADSPPVEGAPSQGGPTGMESSPDWGPESGEPDQSANASPSLGVEAIDAIIQSFWDEERATDSHDRLPYIVRSSDRVHDEPLPVRLADWPRALLIPADRNGHQLRVAAQPARSGVGADRRIGEVLPRLIDKKNPEPAPALAFLLIGTMAHEWVHPRRWHRTIRLGRPGGLPRRESRSALRG